MTHNEIKALEFAMEAHKDQTRKLSNEPYINHPTRVASRVIHKTDSTDVDRRETLVQAAFLHDVIEDCEVTVEDLLNEGFSPRVVELVELLSNPGFLYPEFIFRLMHDKDAALIKSCDIEDNAKDLDIQSTWQKKLFEKYSLAYYILTGNKLPVPNVSNGVDESDV